MDGCQGISDSPSNPAREGTATRIRAATSEDAEAIAQVIIDTWRDAYRGMVPDAVLANLSHQEFTANYRQALEKPQTGVLMTLVAEDERGQVVGVVSTAPAVDSDAPYTVQIRVLYVLPAYQGRRMGRALVQTAAERFVARGHNAMVIWVLEANIPARRFYEALDGQLVGERTREILSFVAHEVAYGWPDLTGWLSHESRAAHPGSHEPCSDDC